jgi:hypothetical protein
VKYVEAAVSENDTCAGRPRGGDAVYELVAG